MKIYKAVFILIISLGINHVYSQPDIVWAKIYSGPSNLQDSGVSLVTNSLGMVFVTGWSLTTGTNADIVTLRYNPVNGDSIWVSRYIGSGEDKVTSMFADNSFVYVTGWSFSPTRDIITIKYDANTGAQQWVRLYNGTGNGGDYGFAITADAAGNVYVAGRSDVGGAQKYTILKYDASGTMSAGWPVVYTGGVSTVFDEARALRVDASGAVYVTGRSGPAGAEDYLTIKINSSGVIQWVKKYNGTLNGEDFATSMVLDNTETNVFVGGYSFRAGGVQDYVVLKYSASTGDSLAAAIYNPNANTDILSAMARDNLNNIYVTGYSFASGTGFDYATIKYNSNLVQQWVARTTNSGNDFAYSISVNQSAGIVVVTGGSVGSGSAFDYLTVSYDINTGAQRWQRRENGSSNGNDYASAVVASDTDKVFVTGSATFTASGISYYTIRYSKVSGIKQISSEIPESFSLYQNYPNPFNPETSIEFDIPENSFVKLSVYDITGRELEILVNENLSPGRYSVLWNAEGYSSGVYFYRILSDGKQFTRKMIISR
jgi:hypothetical protein